ncbi:sensor histidine kinase [Halostreptopolyspora alba]|uniref:histidine kinase n=1 Tax=Halostreptopolyspora alba TaxID=2487137 RepID=A0A3N0E5Y8_9ACTN|nr:sensor histidine kinase [Nocardiopsaceae bacterium YIM 96095]
MNMLVRGWRAARYLLRAFATGLAAMVALPVLALCAMAIPLGGLGVPLPPHALEGVRRWAAWEHREACEYTGAERPPWPEAPPPTGWRRRLRHTLDDPATSRSVRWLLAHAPLGTLAGMVGLVAVLGVPSALGKLAVWWAMPEPLTFLGVPAHGWGVALGGGLAEIVAFAAVFLWAAPPLAGGYARLTARLLSPSEAELRADRLTERVEELSHTRAEALQAHGAELRRIERDLHDGAQAQLVTLAMRVGLAERVVTDDPDQAARLLREARGSAEDAMTELRDVIRTMYPPVLADRGLGGAVSALGSRCAVPTHVRVGELGTLPAAVEAAAYFGVAEALTNVTRHSGATSAEVRLERLGQTLRVGIHDNGTGGAEGADGTGINGIRRRVAALDGTISVSSPAGGPTVIEVELPCAS